jgi:hypothetical protein
MISGFIPSRLPAVWGLMGPQREDRADFHCPVATESNIHRSQGSSGSRASDVGSVIRLETFLDGGKNRFSVSNRVPWGHAAEITLGIGTGTQWRCLEDRGRGWE